MNNAIFFLLICISVHDGDTVKLFDGTNTNKIRLYAIDAPELKQPFGKESRIALSNLIFGKEVYSVVIGKERYGRTLAVLYLHRKSVNAYMVRNGFAWVYPGTLKKWKQFYLRLQLDAQTNRRGLWADNDPVEPWVWRKNN